MAITKETEISKIEVVGKWNVQVATDTIIKEDDVEISRTKHRHVLQPCIYNSKKEWVDTDISGEATEVQAVANAVWTDTIKTNYKAFIEAQVTASVS
jgi:hypothetical protein|tara:strand:+ start:524 stop:814 length:291 start_codon:yes stop_codon:yes gene_type:complete